MLAMMDEDISARSRILEQRGIRILTSYKCLSIENGLMKAENMKTGKVEEIDAPMTLVAIGRAAVIHEETYDKLGLKYTRKGVEVDDYQRTSVPGIWAVETPPAVHSGACRHSAEHRGSRNIMKKEGTAAQMDYAVIPAVIYLRNRGRGNFQICCAEGAV